MNAILQGQNSEALPTIEENTLESSQDESCTSQGGSASKVRNGIKRQDKQPALCVVQPPSPSVTSPIKVDFKYLDDGRVVELVEDPSDATKSKLAVFDSGKVYLTDSVDYRGQLLVPLGRMADGLGDIILPRGPRPYQSAEAVFWRTRHLITSCVALPDLYSIVTAAIVLNSWFADRLQPPVYLLLTGLPQSGKSTLLQTLQLLCRRPLLVSHITSAAAMMLVAASAALY